MKDRNPSSGRSFGSEVIQLLIPHRRPFLMVDRVVSYSVDETPSLTACRHISANEEVFAGHFPGWEVWPGVYTIEGLGQCCMILSVLDGISQKLRDDGVDADALAGTLRNMELGYRMHPGYRQRMTDEALAVASQLGSVFGLGSAVNVKLTQPVFSGQRLDYSVELTRRIGNAKHYEVEASVDGQSVARGALGSSTVEGLPRLG